MRTRHAAAAVVGAATGIGLVHTFVYGVGEHDLVARLRFKFQMRRCPPGVMATIWAIPTADSEDSEDSEDED